MKPRERLEAIRERLGACGDTVPRELADATLALADELLRLTGDVMELLVRANDMLADMLLSGGRLGRPLDAESIAQAIFQRWGEGGAAAISAQLLRLVEPSHEERP